MHYQIIGWQGFLYLSECLSCSFRTALFSCLLCFWWQILYNFYVWHSVQNIFLSLGAFKMVYHCDFKQFDYDVCLGVFFIFILLGIYSSSWICRLIVSSNLENCLPYIVKYFFLSHPLLRIPAMHILGCSTLSHSLWMLFLYL